MPTSGLQRHQEVPKQLRDTNYTEVSADRVYPAGVSRDHFSKRAKGLAVILYLLGLSYGAVSLVMEALGLEMSKTLVYNTVQEVARRVPGMKQAQVFEGMQTPALGSDVTSVKVNLKGSLERYWQAKAPREGEKASVACCC